MTLVASASARDERYRVVNRATVRDTAQWQRLGPELREAIEVVSLVLPFRTNSYVMDQLIDWDRVPDDPIYQLTFPQRGMLPGEEWAVMAAAASGKAHSEEIAAAANRIQMSLNPHPAGQETHNVPTLDGCRLPGLQHKYAETVLFFPKPGQTCHAYCSYCFRWAQLMGNGADNIAATDTVQLVTYLKRHPEVTDVLITGGDPMMMRTRVLAEYVEPLLALGTLTSIRIGTRAPATWPQRFTSGADADDALRLFERVIAAGKHLALMVHYTHPVELSTDLAQRAVRRLVSTGANVRMQSPVARHINDDSDVWADLWREGVRLGCIPYYMFVLRDTGAQAYFELPLARTWEIFQGAYQRVSGLARSARGPSMSAFPAKVHVLGIAELGNEKVFVLEYLQARNPDLVRRPFFARFDPEATWFDQLRPAAEQDKKFFVSAESSTEIDEFPCEERT